MSLPDRKITIEISSSLQFMSFITMDQTVKPRQVTVSKLINAGKTLHARGWVPATSGNFSMRLDPDSIAITVSGKDKGALTPNDIMTVDHDGRPLDNQKPSAETELHSVLYKHFPDINVVLHTHSINATLISQLNSGELKLSGYELLKAFHGINTHDTFIKVPIFANDQNIGRLSQEVARYLENNPPIYGYLITGHGLYAWGESMEETMRYVEAFEFLFECELKLRGAR